MKPSLLRLGLELRILVLLVVGRVVNGAKLITIVGIANSAPC